VGGTGSRPVLEPHLQECHAPETCKVNSLRDKVTRLPLPAAQHADAAEIEDATLIGGQAAAFWAIYYKVASAVQMTTKDIDLLGDRTTAARFANSYKVKKEIPVYLVALTFGVLLFAGLTSAQYPNATGGQVGRRSFSSASSSC
jgi:hypothetical protein